jgi:hypothetical protein
MYSKDIRDATGTGKMQTSLSKRRERAPLKLLVTMLFASKPVTIKTLKIFLSTTKIFVEIL